MELNVLLTTSRSVVYEINDGGIYNTKESYQVSLEDGIRETTSKVINGLYQLEPDREYQLTIKGQKEEKSIRFRTKQESFSLNVREFGAKGDGVSDDTCFIQAAIMACPEMGRVYIPKGVYCVTSLFLKSNLDIEISKDARLKAFTDKEMRPIMPGRIQSYDETKDYNLGTWEGNPLTMYAGIIQGIDVENVVIYGQGVVDGNAGEEDWWKNPKIKGKAYRPRTIFLSHCKNVVIEGITVANSPSWTVHPYFSTDLKFLGMSIINPKHSPNTDALDPESCKNVEITGVYFSVGDDCIAIKSGKIYMGSKFKTPSEQIVIRQCFMKDGHGSVTIGSENAGGVKDITVKECRFLNTDRGLRIKSRRGRGKDAVIDNIIFKDIVMEGVMTPFVVNSFYFCDPDGHTSYVQNKSPLPVDEKTPIIKRLVFLDIKCVDCHVAAAYIYGLPEEKIGDIEMKNISFEFADITKRDRPAMMDDLDETTKMGVFICNAKSVHMEHIRIEGQEGEAFTLQNIDKLIGPAS